MSDIRSQYTDYVRFKLKADNVASYKMKEEPGGWSDDELELERHKDYHGIFTKFSNKLEFYTEAFDYIENAYATGGINANLRLIKDIQKNIINEDGSTDVKWVERYNAVADYNSKIINGNTLTIKFNSNDLAELIKSHETDVFEIERRDSIDDDLLDSLSFNSITLKGRDIVVTGESVMETQISSNVEFIDTVVENGITKQLLTIPVSGYSTVFTKIISRGSERHSAVGDNQIGVESSPLPSDSEDNFFFVELQETLPLGLPINVNINYNIRFEGRSTDQFSTADVQIVIAVYQFNPSTIKYDFVSENEILSDTYPTTANFWKDTEIKGSLTYVLEWNQALIVRFRTTSGSALLKIRKHQLIIESWDFLESSTARFVFVHDLAERLMYILTGQKNKFYSKFFGRKELVDENNDPIYVQDGLDENGNLGGGLIGVTSGFWIRAFDPVSEKYKSLQISLKDLIISLQAVFNIGVGIETVNFKERLRFEELKYFYRNEVIVKLPFQVSDVKRRVDSAKFYSGVEIGYEKGGDYENEIGLDEPNTKTSYVTPIRKSKNKYKKTSKIRADEYPMEIARIKPQLEFPDEDTRYDEHNWFLDIVRATTIPNQFRQVDYDDRLDSLPTGIHSPATFRSMIFTPLVILKRHGWILRSGMETYLNKFVKYISSIANSTLTMTFIGQSEQTENTDIPVSDLERSRFLPEEIEFNHPVDEDLIDLIFGTTRTLINGSYEEVPNFYFKFEWINEYEVIERGYLISLKPKGKGKFKMLSSNENLITT